LFLTCPITSKIKGYPFEVRLPAGLAVAGVILADQIKSLDWRVRAAEFACRTDPEFFQEVLSLLLPLLGEEE
jgi:mRNA interferase MazF